MVGAPGLNSETWESTNLNRPYPLAASHIAAPVELSMQRDIDLIIRTTDGQYSGHSYRPVEGHTFRRR